MSKKFSHKRIRISSLILAVLVCTAVCVLLSACNPKKNITFDSSPCYDLAIGYDAENKLIEVSQEILYTAGFDSEDMVFHIYANAFDTKNSAIDILSAQFNRQSVDYEVYGSDKTLLKLPCELQSGKTYTVTFKYTVKLPTSDTRLGITAHGDANLTCFYPAVAKYDGGWREDCYAAWGDPFYGDISSFYARVTVDENMTVASSGSIVETKLFNVNGKSKKAVEIEAENIRDFGMTIGNFECVSENVEIGEHSVNVSYFYYDDSDAAGTLARAVDSLSVFSKTFGDYPYSSFTVAQSNLASAGGMEYGAFVMVSPLASREDYLDTVTHETAHQWWYNAVGNDQINSAWLDEGLTEFCTYYYHYLIGDRAAYSSAMANISRSYSAFSSLKNTVGFDGRMNRPLSSYLTEGEYVAVTYCKGAMLFDTLHSIVGAKKFQAALKRYYSDNIYCVATQDSLIAAFKTQGYNIASIVNGWTDDTHIV